MRRVHNGRHVRARVRTRVPVQRGLDHGHMRVVSRSQHQLGHWGVGTYVDGLGGAYFQVGMSLQCNQICPPPAAPPYTAAEDTANCNEPREGGTCKFTCEPGYTFHAGFRQALCSGGSWEYSGFPGADTDAETAYTYDVAALGFSVNMLCKKKCGPISAGSVLLPPRTRVLPSDDCDNPIDPKTAGDTCVLGCMARNKHVGGNTGLLCMHDGAYRFKHETLGQVVGAAITTQGAGYISAPDFTVANCLVPPTLSATLASIVVASVAVTDQGVGCSGVTVVFSGGGCTTPPTAEATVEAGAVTAIEVTTHGIGCASEPVVGFGDAACSVMPAAEVTMVEKAGNCAVGLLVTGTGFGCNEAMSVTFTGGGCTTQPTGTLVVTGGQISGFAFTNFGEGCDATVTPTFVAGNCGTDPVATVQLSGGFLKTISVSSTGAGCTEPPQIVFAGGNCTTVPVAAVVDINAGGEVTAVAFSDNGLGCGPSTTVTFTWGGCVVIPEATVQITDGSVTDLSFQHRGVNCKAAPTVEVTPTNGGAGAVVTTSLAPTAESALQCDQVCDAPLPTGTGFTVGSHEFPDTSIESSDGCLVASIGDSCAMTCDPGFGTADRVTTRTMVCSLDGDSGAFLWDNPSNPGGTLLDCRRMCEVVAFLPAASTLARSPAHPPLPAISGYVC